MKKNTSIIAGSTVLFLVIAASYLWFDRALIDYFLAVKGNVFYQIFRQITILGESQWYLAGGLLIWLVYRKINSRTAAGGLLLLSSVAISGIMVNIIKVFVGRSRPRLFIHEQIYGFDAFNIEYVWLSFPSGHAATALGAASALALLFPRFSTAFYSAGAVIAFSRIILTQHYLSDVIAGSVLGLATTFLFYRFYFRKTMHEPPIRESSAN